jgi:hypothetical protein
MTAEEGVEKCEGLGPMVVCDTGPGVSKFLERPFCLVGVSVDRSAGAACGISTSFRIGVLVLLHHGSRRGDPIHI